MARRSSRVRFVRPAPKTKMWIGAGVGTTVITASAVQLISSLFAGSLLLRPFTILRTRMLISYELDQFVTGESTFGAYGRIVITDAASAIGATAVPDPGLTTGNPEADWFVSQPCHAIVDNASSVGFQNGPQIQYVVDSKAMRKVGPDDDVVGMFSEENGKGAFLTTMGRVLIQLH